MKKKKKKKKEKMKSARTGIVDIRKFLSVQID